MNETLLFIIQFAVGLFLILKGADSVSTYLHSSLASRLWLLEPQHQNWWLVLFLRLKGTPKWRLETWWVVTFSTPLPSWVSPQWFTQWLAARTTSDMTCHSVLLLPSLSLPWQTMLYSRERALAKAAFHEAMASRCSASSSSSSPTLLQ